VEARGGGDGLSVVAEHTSSGDRWRGEFTGAYVEAIAEKTGNPKRFPVFLRILFSAIRQESPSVFIDLLTYQDLEAMKQSRGGGGGQRALSSRDPANNKRYVIVTYASEFDRVHYPLPLMYEGRMERRPEAAEAERELAGASPYDSHAAANARKKSQRGSKASKSARGLRSASPGRPREAAAKGGRDVKAESLVADLKESQREVKLLRKERDLLRARAQAAEAELSRERNAHRREAKRRAKDLAAAEEENGKYRATIRELRGRVRDLTGELTTARRQSGSSARGAAPRSRSSTPAASRRTTPRSSARPTPRSSRAPSPSYSSRGASPSAYGSRGSSRERPSPRSSGYGRQPPSTQRVGRSPSPRPRFDPTAYVQQQKERAAEIQSRRNTPRASRSSSPATHKAAARSGASSGHSTPSYPRSRGSSAERGRRDPSEGGRASARGQPAASKAPARSWSEEREVQRVSHAAMGGGRQQRTQRARAESPGRALRDVQAKLNEYANQQAQQDAPNPVKQRGDLTRGGPASAMASAAPRDDDTNAEIADIDARLNALQSFLQNAGASH